MWIWHTYGFVAHCDNLWSCHCMMYVYLCKSCYTTASDFPGATALYAHCMCFPSCACCLMLGSYDPVSVIENVLCLWMHCVVTSTIKPLQTDMMTFTVLCCRVISERVINWQVCTTKCSACCVSCCVHSVLCTCFWYVELQIVVTACQLLEDHIHMSCGCGMYCCGQYILVATALSMLIRQCILSGTSPVLRVCLYECLCHGVD